MQHAKPRIDVLIATALQDELDAVHARCKALGVDLREMHEPQEAGYFVGKLQLRENRTLSIGLALVGQGETAAASRVSSLASLLNPSCIAMCGICAGWRKKIRLGDVIVAERIYSCDDGKVIRREEPNGVTRNHHHDIKTFLLDSAWQEEVGAFAKTWTFAEYPPKTYEAQRDWLLSTTAAYERGKGDAPTQHPQRKTRCPDWTHVVKSLLTNGLVEQRGNELALTESGRNLASTNQLLYPDGLPEDRPARAHLGAMATAKTVREDATAFEQLEEIVRTTIALEMEAAAVALAATSKDRRFFVVKAVSDYADNEKDDRFRHFACNASADFLLSFLIERGGKPRLLLTRQDLPQYDDEQHRALSEKIEKLEKTRTTQRAQGEATTSTDNELVELKRLMRRGGHLHAGDRLNHDFLLIEKLGEGGFATVWKALDVTTDKNVAVKALHPQLATDQTRIHRFRRGAREMADLQHPAIVRVLRKVEEDERHYFFVMELVTGGDMHSAVREQRITKNDGLVIVLRIADALVYAHECGVLHRDVKPSNILLDAAGAAKLTDFDLVAAAHTTGGTRTGAIGSAVYAAPELLERPQHADVRADIYGLAMTAIFALSGKDISLADLRRFDELLAKLDTSTAVREVLRRAVEHELQARFSTMHEFRNALSHALSSPRASKDAIVASAPLPATNAWKLHSTRRSKGFILELRSRPDDFAPQTSTESSNVARSFNDAWASARVLTASARDLYLLALAEERTGVRALAVAIAEPPADKGNVPEGTVFIVMERASGAPGWEIWVDVNDPFFRTYSDRVRQAIEAEGVVPVEIGNFDAEEHMQALVERFRAKAEPPPTAHLFVEPAVRVLGQVQAAFAALDAWLLSGVPRALLVGPFGSGKTTLLDAYCKSLKGKVPIRIRAAEMSAKQDAFGVVLHAARVEENPANRAALVLLLRRRALLICVDGLDELTLEKDQTLRTRFSQWAALGSEGGQVLLSIRPHSLGSLGDSETRFDVEPLEDAAIRTRLEETLTAAESALVWDHLQEDPAMLALMRRHALLVEAAAAKTAQAESVFAVFFARWLEWTSKGATSSFSKQARIALADAIALSLFHTGHHSFDWSDLQAEERKTLELLLGTLSKEEALAELSDAALLVLDEDGRYRFAHRALQAACLARGFFESITENAPKALATKPLPPELIRRLDSDRAAIVEALTRLLQNDWQRDAATKDDITPAARANALRILIGLSLASGVPEGADLRGVRLMGESLAGLRLIGARLMGADLSGADLSGADLSGADLSGSRLVAAKLDQTTLRNTTLQGADLTYVAANQCDLAGANLRDAVLRQSVWLRCSFEGTSFTGADTTACILAGMSSTNLPPSLSPRWLEATLGCGPIGPVSKLEWDISGTRLVCGDHEGSIMLFEGSTGALLARLEGHEQTIESNSGIRALAWEPAGTHLVSLGSDGTVRLWDPSLAFEEQMLVKREEEGGRRFPEDRPNCLAWHPHRKQIALGSLDGIHLVDSSTGAEIAHLASESRWSWERLPAAETITWHPSGERMLVGSTRDKTAWLDVLSGKVVRNPDKSKEAKALPDATTKAIRADAVDTHIAMGDEQGRIWLAKVDDYGDLEGLRSFQAHTSKVMSLSLSAGRLASGGCDPVAYLWDPATGRKLARLDEHRGSIRAVAVDPRGERFASGDGWGQICVWDTPNERMNARLGRSLTAASAVMWSPEGERLATTHDDGSLRVWDTTTGRMLAHARAHRSYILDVAWAPDGKRIATASQDRTARIWDATTLEELARLEHEHEKHGDSLMAVSWHPSGERVVTCTSAGPIEWDVAKRSANPMILTKQPTFIMSPLQCRAAAWDKSGQRLAAGLTSGAILVWAAGAEEAPIARDGHGNAAWVYGTERVAWKHDGKQLATGGVDRTVCIWETETMQELRRCVGHTWIVTSLSWSPDGTRIASASWDKTVRIWDAETGRELACLSGHNDRIEGVDWEPNGRRIASAGKDGNVCIWDATSYALLCTFEAAGPRSLARTPGGSCLFENQGGEGPAFCLAARQPERPLSSLFLPLGALLELLHRPTQIAAALRGDLSEDDELEQELRSIGLAGGVRWDGKRHLAR